MTRKLIFYSCDQRWSRGHNAQGQGIVKKFEAKAKAILFEDTPSQGQGQEWLKPRAKDTTFLNYVGKFSILFKRKSV